MHRSIQASRHTNGDFCNATAMRSAHMLYLMRQGYGLFITLTIGGAPSPADAKRRLGLWSAQVDHDLLGRSYQRHPQFRMRYTAIPEKLAGHWHYHLGAKPPQPASGPLTRSEFEFICWAAWSAECPNGAFHFRTVDNQLEMARYMTKSLRDQAVLENIVHSTEFHPIS